MRKGNRRTPRPIRAPMLVVLHTVPELSLTERLAVEAFAGGWAGKDHFDALADCRNMLMFAASDKQDEEALGIARMGWIALQNIRDRYAERGRFGVAGDELQALRMLVDYSEQWWKRQPGSLFETHFNSIRRARAC